jgi:lysyl-tRNA synthetase class 2
VRFEVERQEEGALVVTRALHVHAAQAERGRPRPHAPEFARFTGQVRAFLESRGLKEIFTPTLVACPGLEPSLEAFETKVTKGKETWTRYLPTSPEIHLKKAMALGWTDVFEIRSCFRRGEFSEQHANEFHMLEWYRGFADLELIIEDLRAMLKSLKAETLPLVTDFRALFKEILDFDLQPGTTREELAALAPEAQENDTFTDIFHRIMIARIEPAMESMGPLIVRRFPPEMAALAKLDREG